MVAVRKYTVAKIVIIGAGSVVFTRRLLQDVVSPPALRDAQVSLVDVDTGRLELVGAFARRLAADTDASLTIETTTDRAQALPGADYVVTSIRVGDDLAVDQGIPLRHGVDQSLADTIGPGGVFKALRTVPVLVDVCRDMESLCPDAWLPQYTNPMAISCWPSGRRRRQSRWPLPQRPADDRAVGRLHRRSPP